MSFLKTSSRRDQIAEILEQIENAQRKEIVNELMDKLHLDERGSRAHFGQSYGSFGRRTYSDDLLGNVFPNRGGSGDHQDLLVDIIVDLIDQSSHNNDMYGRYDDSRKPRGIRQLFEQRGGRGYQADVFDQLEKLLEGSHGQRYGNRSQLLERLVSYLVHQRECNNNNCGRQHNDIVRMLLGEVVKRLLTDGDYHYRQQNDRYRQQDDMVPRLLQHLLRRETRSNFNFDRADRNGETHVYRIVFKLLDRLFRNIGGNRNMGDDSRFELELIEYLLDSDRESHNSVDLYHIIQSLFEGYDSKARARLEDHDVVKAIFRLAKERADNDWRGQTRNNDILRVLREFFRGQDVEGDRDHRFRNQPFRNDRGVWGRNFNKQGYGVDELLHNLLEGQGGFQHRFDGGSKRNSVQNILDLIDQIGQDRPHSHLPRDGNGDVLVELLAELKDNNRYGNAGRFRDYERGNDTSGCWGNTGNRFSGLDAKVGGEQWKF